jgi:hypothetical protein
LWKIFKAIDGENRRVFMIIMRPLTLNDLLVQTGLVLSGSASKGGDCPDDTIEEIDES